VRGTDSGSSVEVGKEAGSADAEPGVAPGDAGEGTDPAPAGPAAATAMETVQASMEELLAEAEPAAPGVEDAQLRAVLEAIIYVAEEPLTLAQIAAALREPAERIRKVLEELAAEYDKPEHGITVREVAGGYKMATKPEHHEGVRSFVKSLKPPLKLSLPALETLAVIAYKQPVTAPEIMEIRGVQGAGVLKTLLDRKLIAVAGRKNVIGKPILYKTTKEFLIQFGLKDLSELPSLKEFEEIRRMALSEGDVPAADPGPVAGSGVPVQPSADAPGPGLTPAAGVPVQPSADAPGPGLVAGSGVPVLSSWDAPGPGLTPGSGVPVQPCADAPGPGLVAGSGVPVLSSADAPEPGLTPAAGVPVLSSWDAPGPGLVVPAQPSADAPGPAPVVPAQPSGADGPAREPAADLPDRRET
jgi:segregation and condensation protein B